MEYEREAYVEPIGNIRVTFDTCLRTTLGVASFFDGDACMVGVIDKPEVILEVKYNEVFPRYISGLLPDSIRPRLAIGKFVICRNQQICQTGIH